jgi:hypothetical protein
MQGHADQTPPQPPFYQCIIKAVGFFTVGKPIKPSKTTLTFPYCDFSKCGS